MPAFQSLGERAGAGSSANTGPVNTDPARPSGTVTGLAQTEPSTICPSSKILQEQQRCRTM